MLTIRLGSKNDVQWAQETVKNRHYLRSVVHNQARPMVYVVELHGQKVGLCMVGLPHATKNKGWWGYEGLPTQWQVVDLSRIWLDPAIQSGGAFCTPDNCHGFVDRKGNWRPAVASWLIKEVLGRVQNDRVSLWPPIYPDKPYHILLAISYHDPSFHKGTIYQQTNATPMYFSGGRPCVGPAGKYGWVWRLPEPSWSWQDIQLAKPRTFAMFS